MANTGRNQEYLGIDSNVLLAYLIPDHPDHAKTKALVRRSHAVNPTVIHEAYHTSVFKLRRDPAVTVKVLIAYIDLALTIPIGTAAVRRGLGLAAKHSLGGRDALILASYLLCQKVESLVTFDHSLLALKKISVGRRSLSIVHPDTLQG